MGSIATDAGADAAGDPHEERRDRDDRPERALDQAVEQHPLGLIDDRHDAGINGGDARPDSRCQAVCWAVPAANAWSRASITSGAACCSRQPGPAPAHRRRPPRSRSGQRLLQVGRQLDLPAAEQVEPQPRVGEQLAQRAGENPVLIDGRRSVGVRSLAPRLLLVAWRQADCGHADQQHARAGQRRIALAALARDSCDLPQNRLPLLLGGDDRLDRLLQVADERAVIDAPCGRADAEADPPQLGLVVLR